LVSKKYTDLIIRCSGKEFKVHCAIVCTRSSVLAGMVEVPYFLSSSALILEELTWTQKAVSPEVDLDNVDIPVIAALINYLYSGDYDDSGADRFQNILPATSSERNPTEEEFDISVPKVANEVSPLIFNVKMCIAAGVYKIPALQAVATEKLRFAWDNDAFMEAQKLLWGKPNDEMTRKVVAKMAFERMETLGTKEEFKQLLPSKGTFTRSLLEAGQTVQTSWW
jgi:hypothetical protein